MATELFQPKIWYDAYDVTGDMNQSALGLDAEALDETTFADSTRTHKGGLKVISFDTAGLFQAGAAPDLIDTVAQNNIGTTFPISVGPTGSGADGQIAYLFKALASSYQPFGSGIGELLAINLSVAGAGNLVRGTIMLNSTALTATGNGTARQLGAVLAGEKVYASLHVLTVSGTSPTLDVTIDSDDNSGMTTATTQLTFTQATGVTSEGPLTAAGAITDDWWRVEYAITGTTPSFDAVVVIGIL